jgi:uncharacterized protein YndB with AHSA1/START domain
MTDSFADKDGNTVPAMRYRMSPDFLLEMLITVVFEEYEDDKTKLTLNHSGIDGLNAADHGDMQQGWNESFDKFAEYLAKV